MADQTNPSGRRTMSEANRSAGLDIMRALAILFVVMSHCGIIFSMWFGRSFPALLAAGGFFGVELFFVLSGFLIGRLLIDILDRGPTPRAWLIFLVRRWMRTLPLYFLWLLVLAVIWPPHFWESKQYMLWRDLPWFLSLTQNLAWPMVDDWYSVSWSLSVEEWFYILFSGLVFLTAAIAGKRAGFGFVVALFLVVPAILRWLAPDTTDFAEVLSKVVVYRLDAIAFGVVTAWLTLRRATILRHPRLLLVLGVALVVMIWTDWLNRILGLPSHLQRTLIFDFTSLGFALCLPAAASGKWRPQGWLIACVRAVSGQSYAIYIVHLSLLEFANYYRDRLHVSAGLAAVGTVAATALLSFVSYRYFETPILARRPSQHRAHPLPPRAGAAESTTLAI